MKNWKWLHYVLTIERSVKRIWLKTNWLPEFVFGHISLYELCPTTISWCAQKSCWLNEGRNTELLWFSQTKFLLSYCTESIPILTALETIVWHLTPIHKFDDRQVWCQWINKGSNQNTRNKFCTNAPVNTWKPPNTQYRRDKVALKTTASTVSKQGQLFCLYFYHNENLNWVTQKFDRVTCVTVCR